MAKEKAATRSTPRATLILAFGFLMTGSGHGQAPSSRAWNVEFTLKAVPPLASPGNPAKITAEIVNFAEDNTYRMDGCSYWSHGIQLKILDPRSQTVALWDPRTRPLCADHAVPFLSGERFNGVARFGGTVYDRRGRRLKAQDGTYTVIATFWLSRNHPLPQDTLLERRVSFRWNPR